MAGLRTTLPHLQELLSKFDSTLAAAKGVSGASHAAGPSRLRDIGSFGSNPGNLRMLAHLPEHKAPQAPLVVALHGCGQKASEYEAGSGWSTLADRHGFLVCYPEQMGSNNPQACFSWFQPGDTARDKGEALSIRQMVDHAVAHHGADPRRVYVTGLSAGGAMTAVMLATYPEVFAGGAVIAGLPYGAARTVEQAFQAMFSDQSHSARALGDRVREASDHRGPWPKISVWHGSGDTLVKPSNAEQTVQQWINVHGSAITQSDAEPLLGHRRRVWQDATGAALVEAISIGGMAHGVPIAAATGEERCGAAGPFFLDVGVSSTHHIARFWGLAGPELSLAADSMQGVADAEVPQSRELVAASAASRTGKSRPRRTSPSRDPYPAPHDAHGVIAAALKAAGLSGSGNAGTSGLDPAGIIDAALKAAGLRRK